MVIYKDLNQIKEIKESVLTIGSFDGKARNGDYDVILMKYDLDGNKF